jgi:hypothetical protein
VHSRGGASSSDLSPGVPTPVPTLIRDDASRGAFRSKFLLKPDARLLRRAAATSDFGSPSGAFLDVSANTLD